MVQTNDSALLAALPPATSSRPVEPDALSFDWKLVRDNDVAGPLEQPLLMTSGTVTTAELGSACLLGVDHQRRELLCFLGADVDARVFQEVLLPFFCRVMNEVPGADNFGNRQKHLEGIING
ncbi:MAG: hypothetical protein ABSG16_00075 [Candidatus Acidiferrum sp.]